MEVFDLKKVKDIFDVTFINELGQHLSHHSEITFDLNNFRNAVYRNDWDSLEFKQRVRRISTAMYEILLLEYEEALNVLYEVAPNFQGLAGIIFPDYVEQYGLDHWDLSMNALEQFTKFSTAEFAIRAYLLLDKEKVLKYVFVWMNSNNEHVRRLASEGCRPRLPWGKSVPSFKENPLPLIPMLENLIQDDSIYVRKSVANHMNDISKTHPQIIVDLIKKWHGNNQRTDWILRHASRTLLKQADKDVLRLFGFQSNESLNVQNLTILKHKLHIGEDLQFSFSIVSETNSKVRIEYAIDYVKKNGKQSRKIFKISEVNFEKNKIKKYNRRQSFKNMTTRTHYPGLHTLSIIVNGTIKESIDFHINKS